MRARERARGPARRLWRRGGHRVRLVLPRRRGARAARRPRGPRPLGRRRVGGPGLRAPRAARSGAARRGGVRVRHRRRAARPGRGGPVLVLAAGRARHARGGGDGPGQRAAAGAGAHGHLYARAHARRRQLRLRLARLPLRAGGRAPGAGAGAAAPGGPPISAPAGLRLCQPHRHLRVRQVRALHYAHRGGHADPLWRARGHSVPVAHPQLGGGPPGAEAAAAIGRASRISLR